MSGIDAPSTGLRGGAEVFGRNGAVLTANTITDVATTIATASSEALYPGFPVATAPVELFATGTAADTAAGDGGRRIRAVVLRTIASKSYEVVEVDMNGTTEVSIGECYRCIYAEVLEFGTTDSSGRGDNGEIVIATTGGGTDYCTIPAADGQSEECVYTVPAGLNIDIRRIRAVLSLPTTGGSTSCRLSLLVRKFGSGGFVPERTFLLTNQRPADFNFVIPLLLEPLSDVKLQVSGLTTNSSQVNATLDFGP